MNSNGIEDYGFSGLEIFRIHEQIEEDSSKHVTESFICLPNELKTPYIVELQHFHCGKFLIKNFIPSLSSIQTF
jgi:hypothetical protein